MKRDIERDLGLRQARAAARNAHTELGAITLPIDLEGIVRSKEIDLRPLPPEHIGFSGAFVYEPRGGCGILYATSVASEGFRRFTIAHEFGHYSIDSHGMQIIGSDGWHRSSAG